MKIKKEQPTQLIVKEAAKDNHNYASEYFMKEVKHTSSHKSQEINKAKRSTNGTETSKWTRQPIKQKDSRLDSSSTVSQPIF